MGDPHGATGTSREPSVWRAAFTRLQLPMLQELFTLKRRKRRAPVQGFDARIVRGNISPKYVRAGSETGVPAGCGPSNGRTSAWHRRSHRGSWAVSRSKWNRGLPMNRKRRATPCSGRAMLGAPVQGFNARMVRGNISPKYVRAGSETGAPAGCGPSDGRTSAWHRCSNHGSWVESRSVRNTGLPRVIGHSTYWTDSPRS